MLPFFQSGIGSVLIWLILIAYSSPASGETPKLFTVETFSAADLARAANYYVSMGERDALAKLNELGKRAYEPQFVRIHLPERMSWVANLIFVPKSGKRFRLPMLGSLSTPPGLDEHLPLFPVVQSGSSCFVIAQGYILFGTPEPTMEYVRYCRSVGVFRRHPLHVPTRNEAERDAVALRHANTSKAFDKYMASDHTWSQVKQQADAIEP